MSGGGEEHPPGSDGGARGPDAVSARHDPGEAAAEGRPAAGGSGGAVRHRGVLDPERDEALPVGELADPARLRAVVQSLLLVADRSLTPAELAEALGPGVPAAAVREAVEEWMEELSAGAAGIRVLRVAGGYRLRTDPASAPWVRRFTGRRPVRLSRAALESLAIVAYRQPVTRAEVDSVRGVDSSVVLRSMLEKDLLRIVGRKDEPGRPMLYGTTRTFLEVFGLDRLADLPSLKEFTDLALSEQAELFADDSLGAAVDDPGGAVADDPGGEGGDPPPEGAGEGNEDREAD